MPDAQVDLRPLEPSDKVTGLKLGDAAFTPLKTFFQKHAKTYHAKNLGRTYVVTAPPNGKIVGYMTLVSGEVTTDVPLNEDGVNFAYETYPAVKIARLATHLDYRGSGLGRFMVDTALGIVKDMICPRVGCRFVVVDSKQQSVDFYRRCGFVLLDTEDNHARNEPIMFVDVGRVET